MRPSRRLSARLGALEEVRAAAIESIALLERLGFQYEGRLRGERETHIGVRDSLIYGLLRDEWTMEKKK